MKEIYSSNNIWFNTNFYEYRIFTTWCQIILTVVILFTSWKLKEKEKITYFLGWVIPLYFGLLLLYSAIFVGLYSPASIGGLLTILMIGFVFYKPKVIYSIAVIVTIVYVAMCLLTAEGRMMYAPLFSDQLNGSHLYSNQFWLKSMVLLYLPILIISALFFEVLLRQWRRRESKIEKLSQTDSLTEVYNRRYLNNFIKNTKSQYAMIVLDLDFFKKVNDNYGHESGDLVLCRVAEVLRGVIRTQDIVGRLGGEEFALILSGQDLVQAVEVAERCRKSIEMQEIVLLDGTVLNVTASFGVAVAQRGVSMEEVARLADNALYLSKQRGRNQVQYSD